MNDETENEPPESEPEPFTVEEKRTAREMARRKDTIEVGPNTSLVNMRQVASRFGMTMHATTRLVRDLGVPVLSIGRDRYVNQQVLDFSVFCLTIPGRMDYAAPGSRTKRSMTQGGRIITQASLRLNDSGYMKRCLMFYRGLVRSRAEAATETAKRLLRRTVSVTRPTRLPPPKTRAKKDG